MTQPHPTSSPQDQPTPPCEPASEAATNATSSGRFAHVMDRLSLLAAMRKIAQMEWMEVVGFLALAILVAVIVVGILLVAVPAILLVIPLAVPVAALALMLVALVKLAARTAGDD